MDRQIQNRLPSTPCLDVQRSCVRLYPAQMDRIRYAQVFDISKVVNANEAYGEEFPRRTKYAP